MVRGLFGGLVWGGLLAGVGLATLSILTPLQEAPGTAQIDDNRAPPADQSPTGAAQDIAAPSAPESEVTTSSEMTEDGAEPQSAEETAMEAAGSSPEPVLETALPEPAEEPDASETAETAIPPSAPTTEGAELTAVASSEDRAAPPPPMPDMGRPEQATSSPQLTLNEEVAPETPVQTDAAPAVVEVDTGSVAMAPPTELIPEATLPTSDNSPEIASSNGPGRPTIPDADPRPMAEATTPPAAQLVPPMENDAVVIVEDPASPPETEDSAVAGPPPLATTDGASAIAEPAPEPVPTLVPSPDMPPEPAPEVASDPPTAAPIEPPRRVDAVPVRRPGAETAGEAASATPPGLRSSVEGVTTGRLPRIDATGTEGEATQTGAGVDAGSAEPTGAEAPPYIQFARGFENPAAKPVFAIVLRDTGGPDIDREALAALPFPVSFAIDPTLPDAQNAALIYRAAGQEVLMLATGLPEGATASDIEVTFGVHARTLEEAVAVLDPETGGVQGNRGLAQQVLEVVKSQGRGVLSWDRGLNAVSQIARREGMQNGVVFRNLDAEGEAGPVIRRYLDRAAFKAAQDGRVIVAGRTRPETVAAILEWTVEGRADTVALAPVTAAMTAQ